MGNRQKVNNRNHKLDDLLASAHGLTKLVMGSGPPPAQVSLPVGQP